VDEFTALVMPAQLVEHDPRNLRLPQVGGPTDVDFC
jgi:hypothetical protein